MKADGRYHKQKVYKRYRLQAIAHGFPYGEDARLVRSRFFKTSVTSWPVLELRRAIFCGQG